jgi:hypothetical protein
MNNDRRKFLRNLTLGAGALAATGLETHAEDQPQRRPRANTDVNMCGYAAPKLNVVRIGIVGLGQRG